jgi:GTP cyclohydrolase II
MTAGNRGLEIATPRVVVQVPLDVGGVLEPARMVSFDGLCDGKEHVAVLFGEPMNQLAPLVRMHSECLTSDVFGSMRCDCGPQLHESIRILRASGGIILYLRQEGRGIGLYNKLEAYLLQDAGYDTYQANRMLDFAEDPRDYTVAAQMLLGLGVLEIRLLSNNPVKAAQLAELGVTVRERLSTGVYLNQLNLNYLKAKVRHAGHVIDLDGSES